MNLSKNLKTKGIILAGGKGTRLFPLTKIISKQLLPLYDKPMIYYPLSTLMLSGIRDILIISTIDDQNKFMNLLGDGSDLGIKITYKSQKNPRGLADAFIVGEKFIGNDNVCMILGDNIFHSDSFINKYLLPSIKSGLNTIFGYYVGDPSRYGVVELDKNNNILSIEEKPKIPKSNIAITGLYLFDHECVKIAKNLNPSKRNEIEIVDLIKSYNKIKKLNIKLLGRGVTWLDVGTVDSLLEASNYVEIIQKRQGRQIGSVELIAFEKKFISKQKLLQLIKLNKNSSYSEFMLSQIK